MLIDLHTHHTTREPHITSIISSGTTPTADGTPCSVGIHPWHITTAWETAMQQVRTAAPASNVVAIGECGIDKLKSSADIALQTEVLAAHAALAEEVQKPLILHCVKGQEEIMKLRRQMAAKQAWIIHGFRGKPAQALQLTGAGFYLSYGERYNSDSLAATPADRLFLETDTSSTPIYDIYKEAAKHLSMSIEELTTVIAQNLSRCNINIM